MLRTLTSAHCWSESSSCRCPASQESIALCITSLGREQNSILGVWYLLNIGSQKILSLHIVSSGPTLVFSRLDSSGDWYRNQKLQAEARTIAQLGFVEDLPEFPSVLTPSSRFCHNIPYDPDLDCSSVVHTHSWVLPSQMCCLPSSISSQIPMHFVHQWGTLCKCAENQALRAGSWISHLLPCQNPSSPSLT